MRVIGTAGHVDHGKSTLVQALTGINPDRLKEEQEREMTIDLGFAWMTMPNGEDIGIIDVPGHRDFIENMLAGVGSIDAALLVVAADEGVMPQTREHLAILDLLNIQAGIVAITKIDLVEEDWLILVEEDLQSVLEGSVLENAPIVHVSGKSRQGIDNLIDTLAKILTSCPTRTDLKRPRLPIDRVFTIAGFGTVVTGTLIDGIFEIGEEVEILPQTLRGRIRGLQTHKQKEQIALPGSRTAINITGISTDQLERGDLVAHPNTYTTTRRLDVHFRLLRDASTSIKHNMETKMFIGTSEIIARIRLLGKNEIFPGEEGFLQLETIKPIVSLRGDRYILRRPSPGETLGGGTIIDPLPKKRYKRFAANNIDRLMTVYVGDPTEVILHAASILGASTLEEIIQKSNLNHEEAIKVVEELIESNDLIQLDGFSNNNLNIEKNENSSIQYLSRKSLFITKPYWASIQNEIIYNVNDYHRAYPLRVGIPREELRSRLNKLLKSSSRLFNASIGKLISDKYIQEVGTFIVIFGNEIKFSSEQENLIRALYKSFDASPFSPPSVKDSLAIVGEEIFSALVALDQLVVVSNDVVFRRRVYDQMVEEICNLIKENGTITAGEVRDYFKTSRKYVLSLLEHMDQEKITVREGDFRKLRVQF